MNKEQSAAGESRDEKPAGRRDEPSEPTPTNEPKGSTDGSTVPTAEELHGPAAEHD